MGATPQAATFPKGRRGGVGELQMVLEAATVADLHRIAAFVEGACARWVPEGRALFRLKLAVDEACANILEHGYRGQAGRLEIEVEGSARSLTIRIRDWGVGFDPATRPAPDLAAPLEARSIGGLGIHLMRQVVDQLEYETDVQRGNALTLHKVLEG